MSMDEFKEDTIKKELYGLLLFGLTVAIAILTTFFMLI